MAEIGIVLDGEEVTVACERVSLRVFNELAGLSWSRGSSADVNTEREYLLSVRAVDTYVTAVDGFVDESGAPYCGPLGQYFGPRPAELGKLFSALLQVQQLSKQQRHDLEVAAKFTFWVEGIRKKGSESHWAKTGTSCQKCRELELCSKRRCGSEPGKSVVWHSGELLVRRCPILSLTREVEEVLRLFYWTHDIGVVGNSVQWLQRHLAEPVGLLDQQAWLTEAFDWLRRVHTDIYAEVANG